MEKTICCCKWRTVSYTHLDVYKRQVMMKPDLLISHCAFKESISLSQILSLEVSTHIKLGYFWIVGDNRTSVEGVLRQSSLLYLSERSALTVTLQLMSRSNVICLSSWTSSSMQELTAVGVKTQLSVTLATYRNTRKVTGLLGRLQLRPNIQYPLWLSPKNDYLETMLTSNNLSLIHI